VIGMGYVGRCARSWRRGVKLPAAGDQSVPQQLRSC